MNSGNKKTILLVEDNAVTARAGKTTLEKFGYRVIHSHSGEKAIELFNSSDKIDLILMDIDLGEGIDGTEAATAILKERDIPIVFLSSHIETEIVEKTEKITSYGYVVKNSGVTVLDVSIKMAFKLFESNQKMKTAEETYRNIFLNAPIGLFRTDVRTGKVIDANDCLAEFAGYKDRAELLGDSFNLGDHYVNPEDRENMVSILEKHGQYNNLEVQFKRRDGSLMWARYSGKAVSEKGWVEGVAEDITGQKKIENDVKIKNEELEATNEELSAAIEELETTNEELSFSNEQLVESEKALELKEVLYRTLFHLTPVMVAVRNLEDGKIVDVNEAYIEAAGLPRSVIIGSAEFDFGEIVNPGNPDMIIADLKVSGELRNREVTCQKNGEFRTLLYSARIVEIIGIKYIVSVMRDITEHKKAEAEIHAKSEELNATNEELEATNEELIATNETMEATNEELVATNDLLKAATDDLRRSEKSLRGKEQQMRTITDNIPVFISSAGAEDLVYSFVNRTLADEFKMSPDQITGRSIKEIIGEEEFLKTLPFIERARSGERVEFESTALIHGEIRWFLGNYIPEFNDQGQVANIIALAFDISDRKKTEEELFFKENRFRSVVEKSLIGIAIINEKARCIYANEEFCRMAGYDENELLGRNYSFLLSEESRPLAYGRFASLQGGEDSMSHYEFSFIRKDGEKRIGEIRIALYPDLSGKINSLIQVIDITERKKMENTLKNAEELYRNIFLNAQTGLFRTDIESGLILDANDCMVRFIGFKDRSELLSKPFNIAERYIDIKDRERMITLLKEHGQFSNFETRFMRNNGSIIWLRFAARIVEDKGWIEVVSEDITERKLADEKIKILLAEKELILKEVHHRIKNNMNTINSILTLHADTLKDPLAINALEDAGGRVHSMMVLYDKLYQSPDFNEISIKNYLLSLLDEIMANFPHCSFIRLEKKIDNFILDVKRLQPLGIIINELFTNIIKHAIKGKNDVLISISVLLINDYVVVEIKDNGIGMPESVNFETTTGFGLQLVKMLTAQIGGSIRIERENGTGFVIKFRI